ncbi:DedA family protein [Kitasatospora sp. NPDC089509]|uniref:DedA family protein n=1 Tax=Kitasatospora sp. NPDC089509 TaxID=3364079 RepID=UPI00382324AC
MPSSRATSSPTAPASSSASGSAPAARPGASPPPLWQRAEALTARHGGRAVLLARFIPVVRTLAPHFAGATSLSYRRIAPYSATAACLWATAEAGLGYGAAASLRRIITLGGPAVAIAGLITAGCAALWVKKRHRSPHPHDVSPARCGRD